MMNEIILNIYIQILYRCLLILHKDIFKKDFIGSKCPFCSRVAFCFMLRILLYPFSMEFSCLCMKEEEDGKIKTLPLVLMDFDST